MSQLKELDNIILSAEAELKEINDLNELVQKKANYLGKKGVIAQIMANMRDLSVEERKEIGMQSNKIKQALEEMFENSCTRGMYKDDLAV